MIGTTRRRPPRAGLAGLLGLALLLLSGVSAQSGQAGHALRATRATPATLAGQPDPADPQPGATGSQPGLAVPPWAAAPWAVAPRAATAPSVTGAAASIGYPEQGGGVWTAATGGGEPAGTAGPLLRYAVAVERDITGVDPQRFAAEVSATLADPRGWTGGGAWRLQWIGGDQPHDFTVHLATPGTRDVLCESGYDRYTSCREGDRVVLNVARWAHGVPGYGAGLDEYRRYLVDHEVGHLLGQGHELCTGPGRPAPVMQQQTLGLHGCTANPWVYLDGRRYAGPSGEYDDPVPGAPPAG